MNLKDLTEPSININNVSQAAIQPSSNLPTKQQINKKRKYIYLFVILSLILIIIITAFALNQVYSFTNKFRFDDLPSADVVNPDPTITPTPTPILIPNPINGIMIGESEYNTLATRPFLAVMIQNNIAARPPSGLNEADIVYETLVESNITRFMPVYWSKDAERLQSLRSARHYFVNLLGDYNNPAYMHIGFAYCVPTEKCDTRVDSLVLMNKYSIRRLSDSINSVTKELSFSRDKNCEKIKASEHCAYTSTSRLWTIAEQKKWTNDLSKYKSWTFVDAPRNDGQKLTQFLVHFKNFGANFDPNYSVIWKYDEEKNVYLRFNQNGAPYNDSNGIQISASTVIYQKVKSTPTGDDKGRQYQEVIGSGTGYVMQGGKVYPITWNKPDFTTKTVFTYPMTGKNFEFQRGKMWVMVVPNGYDYIDQTPKPTISPTQSDSSM